MKIAIVGSRGYKNLGNVRAEMERFALTDIDDPAPTIISGGAIGPDSEAEVYAKDLGWPTEIYLPDWKAYGKSAGFIRNSRIVAEANVVWAFWDGLSRGTLDTIQKATVRGIQVIIFPDTP